MDRIKQYAGLLLIIIGVLALALTRIASLNGSNTMLLAGLLLIVAGIVTHIWSIKHESKY